MIKCRNYYKANEGKQFVLTQKGKEECASYKYKNIGEVVDEYNEVPHWAVEKEYVEEVDIPNWKTDLIGFVVGYYHKGYFLSCGNYQVFPKREIAEVYKKHYESLSYVSEDIVIEERTYAGIPFPEVKKYHEGKEVIDEDHYFGLDAHEVGSLFCEDMIDDFADILPPVTCSRNMLQMGEAYSHKIDENGKARPTYATFVKIADDVWKYVGNCFRCMAEQTGKEIPVM